MKKATIIAFLFVAFSLGAQPSQYFKESELNGFPSLVKQLADYESVKSNFDYFKLDETLYNALFYKSYIPEGNNNARYFRMDITMLRSLAIEPTAFPNYKIILNPELEKGYFSKQQLQVNIRETSVSAKFKTNSIGLVFPQNILQTLKMQPAQAMVKTTAVEYHNDGNNNKLHGLIVKETGEFKLEPSFIPNVGIELTDFKKAEIKFLDQEAYEFPFLVFENNQLANFISNYKKTNKNANVKSPEKYKASVLIKNAEAKVTFAKALDCEIAEIYFFENAVAGVIDFPLNRKKDLLGQLNDSNTVVNREPLKLKADGSFPTVIDSKNQKYYKIEQDSKSIKMYFIIVK